MPQVREGDGRKAVMGSWLRNRSIRITIMTVFVGLLLLTAVPIVWYMHARNTDALLELADELMTHLSESIIAKTTNYLAPASVMAEMSAELAHSDRFSLTEETGLETTAIAILQAYPQLAMFNMGDNTATFSMPKKMPDGSIDQDHPARRRSRGSGSATCRERRPHRNGLRDRLRSASGQYRARGAWPLLDGHVHPVHRSGAGDHNLISH